MLLEGFGGCCFLYRIFWGFFVYFGNLKVMWYVVLFEFLKINLNDIENINWCILCNYSGR